MRALRMWLRRWVCSSMTERKTRTVTTPICKYGISNLSKAQEKLIDGLAEYQGEVGEEDGFPEMAEEMEKRVGISKGIEKS